MQNKSQDSPDVGCEEMGFSSYREKLQSHFAKSMNTGLSEKLGSLLQSRQ